MDRRKPDMAWKSGPCGLAMWRETKKDASGREYESISLALNKSVKTDGGYKDSTLYLYPTDIAQLQALLDTFRLNFMVKPKDNGG